MSGMLLRSSLRCRESILDKKLKKILLAKISSSSQESDLTLPPNCHGYGRIHHFDRDEGDNWPEDPLPNDPACRAFGIPYAKLVRAEVFQCAQCNFDCWYCFVPQELRRADENSTAWFNADELIEAYLDIQNRPPIVDLSGGNPGLVPEWAVWMVRALRQHGLSQSVYLWSDDNLSTDFHWRFLSSADREVLKTFKRYGQVACFKGFDEASFAFNTRRSPVEFQLQFDRMKGLLMLGLDQYGYVTLTCPTMENIRGRIAKFMDRLQSLAETLPLRTVPLKIECYGPTQDMMNPERAASLHNQFIAVQVWQMEIEKRFSRALRGISIADVPLS